MGAPSDRGDGAVTRRALLAGLAGACGVLSLAATAVPAAADSAVTRLPDGRLAVAVNRVPELASVGGAVRIGTIKGRPVAVARTASGYRAFSLACPHQGAIVTRDSNGWVCPAHGSEFTPTGGLVLGPATRGLSPVRSRLSGNTLTVG